ncbi:MAG: hypothetical protein C0483_20840 [Pirellula sp.]|nr:hypothetical protein [Pirellula sp.]
MLGHGSPQLARPLLLVALSGVVLCGIRAPAAESPDSAPPAASRPRIVQELGDVLRPPAPNDAPAETPVADTGPNRPLVTRLRIEWGGGAPQSYRGILHVDGGRISAPAPLGLEPDEPGSMYLEDGHLVVAARGPRVYDGVDVTITAPRSAVLQLQLQPGPTDDAAPQPVVNIPLVDVLQTTFHAELPASGGNRVSARRAPGDRLQVQLPREHVIYRPGEVFDVNIHPQLLGVEAGTPLVLTASLHPARQTKALRSDTSDITAPADDAAWPSIPLSLHLPEIEGVYDVVLELDRRDLTSRIRRAAPAERRKVQVVVLSPRSPHRDLHHQAPEPHLIEEIDPVSPGWWERAKSAALPTNMRRGPLGNCQVRARRTEAGLFLELPPSVDAAGKPPVDDLSWQAYPLAVARPGTPHFLEIEYPSDVAQSLGVSLVEPNAAGAIVPLGVDQGIALDESDVDSTPRRLTRRFVIWPQTAAPLIVVTNRRTDAPAVFGKLRLLGSRAAPLVPRPWTDGDPAALAQAHLPEARAEGRLLAAYYDRPLFPANFSHSAALDEFGDDPTRTLDDWVTFYEGSRRLVEYLAHSGYNGAIVTVAADGGAIYPSALLQATPRYDDGVFFGSGQDPLRKDVLELLLRMFDREGLRLVPTLQLSTPLAGLEAERRRAVDAREPDPVAPRRTTSRTADAAAPLYDPLRPVVERELSAVVAELVERYGAHTSLTGLGLQLSADGYTQLAGLDYGADLASLRRFEQATGIALSPHRSEAELASFVVDEHRAAWLAWRADALSALYGRLQTITASGRTSRRLYLVGAHGWDRPDVEARVRPSLPQIPAAELALLESGVDPAKLARLPGVVWMRPYQATSSQTPAARGMSAEINRSEALDAAARSQAEPAGLLFHESQSSRLASFDAKSPYQPSQMRIVSTLAPAGVSGRRALVHQLASLDAVTVAQGGWLLPLGQEDELRRFAGVLRALPAEKFATLPGAPSYLALRTLARPDGTYLYAANDAAWPVTVTLEVRAGVSCAWRGFAHSSKQAGWLTEAGDRPTAAPGTRLWQARLEPHDVVGGLFLAPGVSFANPKVETAPEIAAELEARIRRLWSGATALQRVASTVNLVDPGFEQPLVAGDVAPAGWSRIGDAGTFQTVAADPHGGRSCARLVATDAGGATIVGEPVTVDPQGRVALSVWVRVGDAGSAPLRLALEGVAADAAQPGFYRFATLGGDLAGAAPAGQWRQFVFQVHDLPPELCDRVRIRLELTGPGQVDLDDVVLTDLDFTEAERLQFSKLITLAELKLRRGELGECARLLDGYWPKFLLAHAPAETPGDPNILSAQRPAAQRRAAQPAAAPEPTGLRDRLRSMLPTFLR